MNSSLSADKILEGKITGKELVVTRNSFVSAKICVSKKQLQRAIMKYFKRLLGYRIFILEILVLLLINFLFTFDQKKGIFLA